LNSSHSRIEAVQNCVIKYIVAMASDQANTVRYLPQSTVCRGGRGFGPVLPMPAETCGSTLPDVPSPAQCCEKGGMAKPL